MAFTTGTATDYIDLAAKLRTFLMANGWSSLAYTPGNVTTGGMSMSLRGPGAAADKQVFVNLRSQHDNTTQSYAWQVTGAIDYNAALAWGNQTGESPLNTYFSLWKNTISYWFYVNDRRFVVIAKCNTVYLSLYAGFVLPWAFPAEYPFPLLISGSDEVLRPYNSIFNDHSMCCDPGGQAGKFRHQSGVWKQFYNRQVTTTDDDRQYSSQQSNEYCIYPYSIGSMRTSATAYRNWVYFDNGYASCINSMVPTAQGERMLIPVQIMTNVEPAGIGPLDGFYFPMGNGLTPEQTAVMGGRTFRFFPNIHRIQGRHFFAIEEV